MKKLIISAAMLLPYGVATAQTEADYTKAVNQFQTYFNNKLSDSIYSLFSDKIKAMLPPDKTMQMMSQLDGQLGRLKTFELTERRESLAFYKTSFEKADLSLVIALNEKNKLETFRFAPYKDESAGHQQSNIELKTPGGSVYGTLTMPEGSKKVPVVLIIAGSGPTDRDGNNGVNVKGNTYKMLADSLKKHGIAAVRYDKRGIGESAAAVQNAADIRFEDMVNDAAGMVKMLKADPRFTNVIVIGHSEGSLIGMMAATRENAAGIVSVAGIAERADKIIYNQIKAQSAELAEKAQKIMDSMANGYMVTEIDPALTTLYAPNVQPYMISWLKYVPQQEIRKLKVPVLIIQGDNDVQVKADEGTKLKKAYPKAQLKIIKGMNHALKTAPTTRTENLAAYLNPTLPLSDGLVPTIVAFINNTVK